MGYKQLAVAATFVIALFSCKKNTEQIPDPVPPPVKEVFLKDITIPNLPSPFYHFEYDTAGNIIKAGYQSGFRNYTVTYNSDKISEVKNETRTNNDILQYFYDNTGKVNFIKYVNEEGIVIKRCFLQYKGNQLQKIEWERKVDAGFIAERNITFVYQSDGNLLNFTSHRLPFEGREEIIYTDWFQQYDNKINVEGFSVFHEEDEHLLLLPAIQLQKNNPGKLIRTGNGVNYTIEYTYTYNDKNAPITKTGDAVFNSGPNTGVRFQVNAGYSYY